MSKNEDELSEVEKFDQIPVRPNKSYLDEAEKEMNQAKKPMNTGNVQRIMRGRLKTMVRRLLILRWIWYGQSTKEDWRNMNP